MSTKLVFPRREFLGGVAAVAGAVGIPGCGADTSGAYVAWDFPDESLPLEQRLVHAALLAASPHNTQPWAFRARPTRVDLFPDDSRSLHAMDALGREHRMGLGCAVENLVVAARANGLEATPREVVGAVQVDLRPGIPAPDELYDAIPKRHTNRTFWRMGTLDDEVEPALLSLVASLPEVQLHLHRPGPAYDILVDGTRDATAAIVKDGEMLAASDAWYRHRDGDIELHRDGVTLKAQGLDRNTIALLQALPRPSAHLAGQQWVTNTRHHTSHVAAFGVLSTSLLQNETQWLAVGRAFQRIHLWCTAHHLALQPLNQLPEMRDREEQQRSGRRFSEVLAQLVPGARHAHMIFRLGYPSRPATPSPRRPVAWVLVDA